MIKCYRLNPADPCEPDDCGCTPDEVLRIDDELEMARLDREVIELRTMLQLRTAALNRVTKQLDEVRALHVQNGSNRCRRCREAYPCETARAAGVSES